MCYTEHILSVPKLMVLWNWSDWVVYTLCTYLWLCLQHCIL